MDKKGFPKEVVFIWDLKDELNLLTEWEGKEHSRKQWERNHNGEDWD